MLKFLPLLWSSLQRRKLRTLFTLASVITAFLLYGILAAVKNGFSAGIEVAGADRLMTSHKVSLIQTLPLSYWSRIRAVPGVRDATHTTWFGGHYQDDPSVIQVFPVDPESYLSVYSEYLLSDADRKRWFADQSGALIGRAIANRFKWKVGDRVPLRSDFYRRTDGSMIWDVNIDGIFDAQQEGVDTSSVLFHYDYFDKALSSESNGGPGQGRVGWYTVKIEHPDQSAAVAAAIDKEFANSPTETKTATEKAFVQGFANQIGNIGAIVIAIGGAVFFTMLLVTANTMAQSVRERTAEIGVLKTLGFADRSILWLVIGESLLLTLIGGVMGLAIAYLVVSALGSVASQYLSGFFLSTMSLVTGIGLAIGLGLIAGTQPAVQALRLRIVEALRRD
jgi:putative ABC transport system permease protein